MLLILNNFVTLFMLAYSSERRDEWREVDRLEEVGALLVTMILGAVRTRINTKKRMLYNPTSLSRTQRAAWDTEFGTFNRLASSVESESLWQQVDFSLKREHKRTYHTKEDRKILLYRYQRTQLSV